MNEDTPPRAPHRASDMHHPRRSVTMARKQVWFTRRAREMVDEASRLMQEEGLPPMRQSQVIEASLEDYIRNLRKKIK